LLGDGLQRGRRSKQRTGAAERGDEQARRVGTSRETEVRLGWVAANIDAAQVAEHGAMRALVDDRKRGQRAQVCEPARHGAVEDVRGGGRRASGGAEDGPSRGECGKPSLRPPLGWQSSQSCVGQVQAAR